MKVLFTLPNGRDTAVECKAKVAKDGEHVVFHKIGSEKAIRTTKDDFKSITGSAAEEVNVTGTSADLASLKL